jgi:hypothetical protein
MQAADLQFYTYFVTPIKQVGALLGPLSLEIMAPALVPAGEFGTAVALLDVLNSAVGVGAPLLMGVLIQLFGLKAKGIFSGKHLILNL